MSSDNKGQKPGANVVFLAYLAQKLGQAKADFACLEARKFLPQERMAQMENICAQQRTLQKIQQLDQILSIYIQLHHEGNHEQIKKQVEEKFQPATKPTNSGHEPVPPCI